MTGGIHYDRYAATVNAAVANQLLAGTGDDGEAAWTSSTTRSVRSTLHLIRRGAASARRGRGAH